MLMIQTFLPTTTIRWVLGTWLGILYFAGVTALVCPGMDSSSHRMGPHLAFAMPDSHGHRHSAPHVPGKAPQLSAAPRITTPASSISPAQTDLKSSNTMNSPLLIRYGSSGPPSGTTLLLTVEVEAAAQGILSQETFTTRDPLPVIRYSLSPVYIQPPDQPPEL